MDSHLKAWDDEHARTAWRGPYSIAAVKERLGAGARVLDAGCGNGKMLAPLARAGFEARGVDIARGALLALAGHPVVQGDVRSLPFAGEAFDGVVCYDVLQHLLEAERGAAVSELRRVLVPGGFLFLQVFGRSDMRYGGAPVEPHTFRRQSGIVYHYFSEAEVRCLLRGFAEISVDSALVQKTFRGEAFTRHRITAIARK